MVVVSLTTSPCLLQPSLTREDCWSEETELHDSSEDVLILDICPMVLSPTTGTSHQHDDDDDHQNHHHRLPKPPLYVHWCQKEFQATPVSVFN